MKPIAKAMTVALGATALIAATSATAGARKARTTPPPVTAQRQTLAPQADGFVIRASIPDAGDVAAPSPIMPRLIPIGADMHLDARLLVPGQTQ